MWIQAEIGQEDSLQSRNRDEHASHRKTTMKSQGENTTENGYGP